MVRNLIFEIGVEEIPARVVNRTLEQFKNISESKFKDNRIHHGEVRVFATPRRLTLYIKDMEEKQRDQVLEIKGPSKKAAYDEEGKPSRALEGFLRGNKLKKEQIYIKELSKTEYVYGKKFIEGEATIEILKELLVDILLSFNFPRSMKWGGKSFRFVRPVRWLLSIFGDELVKFEKDGILCNRYTRGHRVLSDGLVKINEADEYFEKLRKAYVIVDQKERKELIEKQCEKIAKDIDAVIVKDDNLLEEVLYLVEYPTAFLGSFSKEFLSLPKEAVITPMKEHQRYFPLVNRDGDLLNHFIAVRNGDDKYIDLVREGNEKVLRARLSDARFFYEEDKKTSLDTYVNQLKDVVFQEALGTLYDKTNNIRELSLYLAKKLDFEDMEILDRAAYLCKGDLVTNMVKEFDELQGIMGREYAIIQGEDSRVADGIKEHYMPRFAGDDMPGSLIGSILSISDKIDTICGCFSIGIQPTGSQDPYALRRQAIGIINIIQERKFHIDLGELLGRAIKPYEEKEVLKDESSKIIGEVIEFFKGRFKNVLLDKKYDYYIIDAVLETELKDLHDAYLRIKELSKWKAREGFEDIITSFNRVSNLALKWDELCHELLVREELLKDADEKALYELYKDINNKFLLFIKKKDYNQALSSLISMKAPIDKFFDNVMVMVEDEELRDNRLSILKSISLMMNEFADLGSIIISKAK